MSKRSTTIGVCSLATLGFASGAALLALLTSKPVQAIPDCTGENPPPICEPRPRPMPTPRLESPGIDVSIPATILSTIANNLVQGSQLHLNNFGSKQGNSWHKPNDSYIRLPQQLGGGEHRFNLPEKTVDLDCGTFCPDLGTGRFYVQDWNLQTAQVSWQHPQFKLSLVFEGNGREIKGFHTGSISLGDNGMPDANIDNARLDLFIRPAVLNGRLSYQVASADFNANIQATGACNLRILGFGIDGCKYLYPYKTELTKQVEAQVRARLNDPALRTQVANAIQPTLNQYGIGTITQVSVNGDTLVIRHTKP